MFDGAKLEKVLKEQGLSNSALADEVGVSKMFISYLIRGFKQPSVDVLVRICDALGLKTDDLIKKN